MRPDELIDELRKLVRKCFPPDRQIVFSEEQGGFTGNIPDIRLVARVDGAQLGAYDGRALMQMSGGSLREAERTKSLSKNQ